MSTAAAQFHSVSVTVTKSKTFPPSPKTISFPHLFLFKNPSFTTSSSRNLVVVPQCQNHHSFSVQSQNVLKDTQDSISLFLQRFGISIDDSTSIASNCPSYAQMLLDSVIDLDHLNSLSDSARDFGDLEEFKDKVVYIAQQKGDDGKVPFLESLGFPLPSAMNLAPYLSAHSLPSLLLKVNYMKQIFFSGSESIGKIARRMLLHLSIPIDDDLQLTLSLFEKIEARRGGLDMLGSSDATFHYFIQSFPRILLLPLDTHLKPMVELLQTFRVPEDRLATIFLLFPPIILSDINTVKAKILSLDKFGAVDEDFGKMLLKYPWILSTCIQDNYNEILSFCDMEKVAKSSINKAIRSWPHLLGCSTSRMKDIVEQFRALGVKNKKVGHVIAKSPQLLLRKPEEFLQVVSFLKDLGFDQETVGKILVRCPEIFAASVEKTLRRKVEFLNSMGVSEDHLPRTIKKYPELLVSDINRTLLPRMNYLMEVGLSKKEVAFMVRRFSPLLGYSIEEVLRPKYEFLVNTMEKPVKEVVEYPRYFSYSLEKKIKPRYWVLKGRNVDCSLKEMLDKNDEEFADKFMDIEGMAVPFAPHQ